jgi:membrane-associated protein
MIDTIVEMVPVYGFWIIFAATLLSCLAVPIPSSFVMLASGAFVASEDLALLSVVFGAWIGAVIGDQIEYITGRIGGAALLMRAERRKSIHDVLKKARDLIARKGASAVFLSRWLFSPLGPYVNLLAGAGDMRWRAFTLWAAFGEAVWVTIYVSLGYFFAGQISLIAETASNFLGLISSVAMSLILGRALFYKNHPKQEQRCTADQ